MNQTSPWTGTQQGGNSIRLWFFMRGWGIGYLLRYYQRVCCLFWDFLLRFGKKKKKNWNFESSKVPSFRSLSNLSCLEGKVESSGDHT